jgi:MYXO-CTERM domain-containing protein
MRYALIAAIVLATPIASAATLQVGPTRTYKTLAAVAAVVNPGDVVEVDEGTYAAVTFTRDGTAAAPITIRKAGAMRPVISGGTNTIEIAGDYYVIEGFDITGGSSRCVFHHSHGNVLRNVVVHDCPKQGILGADQDSGSLLLEYSEVHHCGGGDRDHQIYMATDEVAHPGAAFRMQFCYVHDANGGNDVKSRAERNEIYYNWLEGAFYHELELIGPDPAGAQASWTEALKREDSDVVGNVLKKTRDFHFVRIGGDATGQSLGRYRFVNNTFITPYGNNVFRLFDKLDSVEMHNNVIYGTGATAPRIIRMDPSEMSWVAGEQIAGTNNWINTGATNIPMKWTGTITGTNPTLVNVTGNDLRPAMGSPLIDKGAASTSGPAGHTFPSPLSAPLFHPPARALIPPGTAAPRPAVATIDIGAYEYGSGPPADGGVTDSGMMADAAEPFDAAALDDTAPPREDTLPEADAADAQPPNNGSCGCHTPGGSALPGGRGLLLLLGLLVRRRRHM